MAEFLTNQGARAVAPCLQDGWTAINDPQVGLASTWSERHAAYAAGLGTFSLNDGLITERGIAHHPEDWRNYFHLGFNHFFYLGDYDEAARVLETAVRLPGRPAYLPRLVARLKSQTSDIEVAEIFLREMLQTTEDEEGRAKLQAALDEITRSQAPGEC